MASTAGRDRQIPPFYWTRRGAAAEAGALVVALPDSATLPNLDLGPQPHGFGYDFVAASRDAKSGQSLRNLQFHAGAHGVLVR